ncbi:serine/threonine-protein phosphatase 2A regulatory subunit B'' subunit beta isoform X1 [Mastacembelus armatus]|uniref:Protein phosphatase 2, regulatory subunit B'', beta n=1 Tax=Mastacembelus armatus TaxID=205130 RepID=A0A3Q3SN43_9TELE|nr:serine/threonine-protein phosphatase 2A regulatory subunit B'' subunit beta-like isoform X1 [Mastacembelus armatus]XP_026152214.1 serine/threonine-protein phosphatase 2A regulatory subunit B'' subunit beta-like isoform X1 [Mastacembelus armatus]XP_026152215.1 serine/threonine-protein phosphatase 2A regulatory subunit B'' subunit beta-like isoform X1 [Mastacembelus armatus]
MPSPQVLQPVLKMKVDELFLNWLSDPATQSLLKDYLDLIKSGQHIDFSRADVQDKSSVNFKENNNVASQKNLTEKKPASLSTPSSPPSATTLPSGSNSSSRVTGPNGRVLRRSVSTKKAQVRTEEPITTALSESIPKFYFPQGRPQANLNIDSLISKIEKIFSQFPNERATIEDMGQVAKACECPLYWKVPLFNLAGGDRTGFVSVHKFVAMWRKTLQTCHDDASKFVHLLAKPGCNYLEQDDFIPFLQDVVNSHAGLAFLKEAPDFHSRYITTVIQRIFYNVNRSWTGKITCSELRKSNFLQNVALLEQEEDVNQLTDFFSYEHFYVIYCKFWELDTDHDLYIDQKDLARHNDQAISHKMIERIFSGTVTRDRRVYKEGRLSYADFVWFLISEEDKKTDTSIEYWFRCMDLDGDGVLSMYELEYFYEEQCQKLEAMAIEPLPFEDCLCQMLDLVKPEVEGKITLRDLKRCKLSHIFFDTFFNIEKYLDHEQKDPFAVIREMETDGQEVSDWEKYAAEEYDILVAEEAANDQCNDVYDNPLSPLGQHISSELGLTKRHFFEIPSPHCNLDLDEYEYDDDFE